MTWLKRPCRPRGLDEVVPGQLIECDLDLVLANDITAPIAIQEFKKIGVDSVFDPTKIALVPDHYTPNKDIKSAEQAKTVRDFAREQAHALLRSRLHGCRACCSCPNRGSLAQAI